MERKMVNQLIKWKSSPKRMPLLIYGARRSLILYFKTVREILFRWNANPQTMCGQRTLGLKMELREFRYMEYFA